MRIPLSAKLMAGYLVVAGLIVAPSLLYLRGSMVKALSEWDRRELRQHAEALRDRLAPLPDPQLDGAARDLAGLLRVHVTLLGPDGTVRSDSEGASEAAAATGAELVMESANLPAVGPPRLVVRVARPAADVHGAASDAMRAMRFATGIGLTVALGLSLGAALFVARPLRRLRDVARAFARSEWVTVKPIRSGDELEDLATAFDELGQKLRAQLVALGTEESLVRQALEALPVPALLLGPQLEVMQLSGALRRHARITAANEGERLTAITRASELVAARLQAEREGLPVELTLRVADDQHSDPEAPPERWLLVPLSRPSSPPLWVLCAGAPGAALADEADQLHRSLAAADRLLDQLWQAHPEIRPLAARVRARLDDASRACATPEPAGIEPTALGELIGRATEELRVLHPELASLLAVEFADGGCYVAESSGMAARAVRGFVGSALRAAGRGRTVALTARVQPTSVRLLLEGCAPPEIDSTRALALALGGDAGRVPQRERDAAWLELPRA